MAEEKKVLKLTLKKPGEAAPAAPAAPAAAPALRIAAPAAAPAVSGGVIKLILQNAKIHIDQVIIKREEKK